MMKKINFYDTSSLLLQADKLFENEETFALSSITLEELEHIKTASNKDADVKFAARKVAQLLDKHIGEYDVEIYSESMDKALSKNNIAMNNDAKILACALSYRKKQILKNEVIFVTNDICLKHLARIYFKNVISVDLDNDNYCGYKDIIMTDDEMATFYQNPTENT